jgi:hypothetical protein
MKRIVLKFPNQPRDVVLPKPIAKKLIPISMKVGERATETQTLAEME